MLIEITDPFAEPRYPAVSHCEIGKYLAEIMGVKDHWVLPLETLKAACGGGELEAHEKECPPVCFIGANAEASSG